MIDDRTDNPCPRMPGVPADFARRQIEVHGAAGAEWLARLPALLAECEQRWALELLLPFAALSYNYVAPAIRADGTSVVLKAGVPNRELSSEIAALQFYDGRGAVGLLDADPDRGILLLEQLEPGTPLADVEDDEQATSIAASVMRQLWRPVSPEHTFPTVAGWAAGLSRLRQRFDGGTGPLPASLVARAERLFTELLASSAEPVLLHGDLHHWNILAGERQPWLALDPKGLVGEPAYEVGPLLQNRLPSDLHGHQARRMLARRVNQLADELGFDRARLIGWGIAQVVLSAWWSIEDHGHGWEPAIACAEVLAEL